MKRYIKPETEIIVAMYGEGLMDTLSLPKDDTPSTGGGDAKQGFFDDSSDGYGPNYIELDRNQSSPRNLWAD